MSFLFSGSAEFGGFGPPCVAVAAPAGLVPARAGLDAPGPVDSPPGACGPAPGGTFN